MLLISQRSGQSFSEFGTMKWIPRELKRPQSKQLISQRWNRLVERFPLAAAPVARARTRPPPRRAPAGRKDARQANDRDPRPRPRVLPRSRRHTGSGQNARRFTAARRLSRRQRNSRQPSRTHVRTRKRYSTLTGLCEREGVCVYGYIPTGLLPYTQVCIIPFAHTPILWLCKPKISF